MEFYLIPGMFHAGELFNPDARISKTVWQRRFDARARSLEEGVQIPEALYSDLKALLGSDLS